MEQEFTEEENQMIKDAEDALPGKLSEKNICTLKNPSDGNIIMMTSIDVEDATAEAKVKILNGVKKNLIVASEKMFIDENSLTEEQANAMIPAAFCKFAELPTEIEKAARDQLINYGEDSTYVALRFFMLDEDDRYFPVLVDVKNRSFVDPTEDDEE